ncbi:capsid protein [Clostridioides difficile]|uniref:capsid protein n=1 Tax=Clostridioides difficile TaxID=1496 RepID=UPI0020C5A2F8|nr:capsid protein [Clostridioides difficile]MCP8368217.1 capsid protein [Clostridioides difficile]HCQ5969090.1 capsid protein [Clostridioides difficile]
MAALNYAKEYSNVLAQAYPYTLNFGDLYATPNNGRYRWTGSKTIEIPTISTTGRVDSNRDTIAVAQRNYDNAWEPKVLTNQRKWSTLVHPADIDQTNHVASIGNITQVYNEEQKFPEMDAYCISKIYADWTALGKVADTTVITTTNVLEIFDMMMERMTEARVPENGRILYVTPTINTLIKNAKEIQRTVNIKDGGTSLNRQTTDIDSVKIVKVPSNLMKTVYDFTTGWKAGAGAKQIFMSLIHPSAIITPVSYQFSTLDEPKAVTEGKYLYFEESFEDVFILNKKADAIQFVVEGAGA